MPMEAMKVPAKPIPFLLLSDAVSCGSGFGRVAREIAVRFHANLSDVFRLGSLGVGAPDSPEFPWPQYQATVDEDWTVTNFHEVWRDFAGDEPGIVFCIWDVSRLGFLVQPQMDESLQTKSMLRNFLMKANIAKWIYCPVDAEGPHERFTYPLTKRLAAFDRILAYTKFGARTIEKSLLDVEGRNQPIPDIPHGIDIKVFFERDRQWSRAAFLQNTRVFNLLGKPVTPIAKDEVLIGIVATNQNRKDWPLGVRTAALLAKDRKVRLWAHVDKLEQAAWSLPTLLTDYGLMDKTIISMGYISDASMAAAYSAADVVLGIAPEGMGYSQLESLACGTPCCTGSYAGGSQVVEDSGLQVVAPIADRIEGPWNMVRPVYDPQHWADYANKLIGTRVKLAPQYSWDQVWLRFQKWFMDGLK
jgi:glycosyltransferase involved in cell wall biosynthesis